MGLDPCASLSLPQCPQQQLGAAVAAGFGQQLRHMAFHRARAQHQHFRNAPVAVTTAQLPEHAGFRWGEGAQGHRNPIKFGSSHGCRRRLPSAFPQPDQELILEANTGSGSPSWGNGLARRIGRLATRAVTRSSVSRLTSPSSRSIST